MAWEEPSDEELMLAYARGDSEAFEALFTRYKGRLFRLLCRLTGDSSLAEDLVQKLFLRVHQARLRYQPTAPFRTWVVSIAYNLWKDERARSYRYRERLAQEESEETQFHEAGEKTPENEGLEEQLDRLALAQHVRAAVSSLPEGQREAIILSRYEDLSYNEIAAVMGISLGAVKLKVHRAVLSLRKQLAVFRSQVQEKSEVQQRWSVYR